MDITDIGKLFTQRVNEYLNKGYYYCINTMSGTQGEDAKIDLTNGKDVVRIFVDRKYNSDSMLNTIEVCVGVYKGKIDYNSFLDIIWNNKLEPIHKDTFYEIDKHGKVWGTKEQANEAADKRYNRRYMRLQIESSKCIDFDSDAVKKMLLPLVQYKVKGCKTAKASELSVYKLDPETNEHPYRVSCRGHVYCLS